jgi:hypothetical protein
MPPPAFAVFTEFKELRKQWRKAKKEAETTQHEHHPSIPASVIAAESAGGGHRHHRPTLGLRIPSEYGPPSSSELVSPSGVLVGPSPVGPPPYSYAHEQPSPQQAYGGGMPAYPPPPPPTYLPLGTSMRQTGERPVYPMRRDSHGGPAPVSGAARGSSSSSSWAPSYHEQTSVSGAHTGSGAGSGEYLHYNYDLYPSTPSSESPSRYTSAPTTAGPYSAAPGGPSVTTTSASTSSYHPSYFPQQPRTAAGTTATATEVGPTQEELERFPPDSTLLTPLPGYVPPPAHALEAMGIPTPPPPQHSSHTSWRREGGGSTHDISYAPPH